MSTIQAAAHGRIVQFSRIRREIADLTKNKRCFIKDIKKIHKCKDVFQFNIIADGSLFKTQVFVVVLDVTGEYPFKAPYLKFAHEVYHPNVDTVTFELCSSMLLQENWKPETTLEDVLLNTIVLLNEPDLSRPVNMEAASDYIQNKPIFLKKCEDLAKKWKI